MPKKLETYNKLSSKPSIGSANFPAILGQPSGIAIPSLVKKRWGFELIYYNDKYCIKQIHINPHSRTSMHFHIQKHETLFVQTGTLKMIYKNKLGADQSYTIPAGEAFIIPPGFQHQLCAENEAVTIIEASTTDNAKDSVRVKM